MGVASKLSKMFSKAEVEKMDKAAKKMSGSPGYDDDTIAAQKEYAKEKAVEKSKKLTKKEEKAADKAAEEFAMGKEGSSKKAKPLTEKEKKELQESLNFKKGGMVRQVSQPKPTSPKKMLSGGMAKQPARAYAKGGMVKCGASNPPAQKGKK
jgi:hypothetical protein